MCCGVCDVQVVCVCGGVRCCTRYMLVVIDGGGGTAVMARGETHCRRRCRVNAESAEEWQREVEDRRRAGEERGWGVGG